jgi:ribonuclease BN (tRNA processing enzyme)
MINHDKKTEKDMESISKKSDAEIMDSLHVVSKHKNKTKKYHSKRDILKTEYDIYKENIVSVGDFCGITSIAARHTAIEYGAIQLDAGRVPREIGMTKLCVLITHFHTDHGSDILNCIRDNELVTFFVPAYCAKNLFFMIKSYMMMQKGRFYKDHEIVKIARVIGCKRDNGEFKDQTEFFSEETTELKIVEYVNMADKIRVSLRGRDEVMIEPFACYHTVDCCGYVIHKVRKKLADFISFDKGSFVDVNFGEDQITLLKKKNKGQKSKTHKKNDKFVKEKKLDTIDKSIDEVIDGVINGIDEVVDGVIDEVIDGVIDENKEMSDKNRKMYDWRIDPKYADIVSFSTKHCVELYPEIIDEVKPKGFVLKVRRLHMPEGMKIMAKNKEGQSILSGDDFAFLKKYKIDVSADYLIPKVMFFGDTGSYVFDQRSVGYKRVMEIMENVETVIIESTYLESRTEMGEERYKERFSKRHTFLFDLIPLFEKFPKTKFLLIHFSACYDKRTVMDYVGKIMKTHPNVVPFI